MFLILIKRKKMSSENFFYKTFNAIVGTDHRKIEINKFTGDQVTIELNINTDSVIELIRLNGKQEISQIHHALGLLLDE